MTLSWTFRVQVSNPKVLILGIKGNSLTNSIHAYASDTRFSLLLTLSLVSHSDGSSVRCTLLTNMPHLTCIAVNRAISHLIRVVADSPRSYNPILHCSSNDTWHCSFELHGFKF